MEKRVAEVTRKTQETDIKVSLNLDGSGTSNITTGIGFFDHMLQGFTKHGFYDMDVTVNGDLNVDGHHTVEDTGIALGQALAAALGDKSGIKRYGTFYIPMDESLAMTSLDISNRPFLVFNAEFTNQSCGGYDVCLTEEFFRAFAFNAGITMHINLMYGSNDHHKCEAIYKSCAHALKEAVEFTESGKTLSTKGVL